MLSKLMYYKEEMSSFTPELDRATEQVHSDGTLFPHCDMRILHAPGQCDVCDQYPRWKALREIWNVNYTNQNNPKKTKCPAEAIRGDLVNHWHGNREH